MNKKQKETVSKLDALMVIFGAASLACSVAARMYEQGAKDSKKEKE